jgi:4-amino-4-deoxy-L-arabinose transferase-like glycosyltransferase
MKINIRDFFILKTLIFGFLIVLFTEIFSFFKIVNSFSIKSLWILIILLFFFFILYLFKNIRLNNNFFKKKFHSLNFEIIFILLIFFLTFLNSLLYPPNTLDAMSYHMTRVVQWMQNSNVNFYPTNDFRELVMGPFSEFVILHLYLLSDGDYFSNLVQWYSMIISCLTASLIAKEFGCNYKFQIFSALFCATLPMGIMQSTSTQTDYVATMWIVITVYLILKYINSRLPKYIFLLSISLGLGILTKGTVYLFAFPFCIWLGVYVIIKKRKDFIYLLTVPLIIIFLNFGHFNRNMNLYGNPIGLSEENNIWTNKIINTSVLASNLLRNLGLNLALPNENINLNLTKKLIDSAHNYLNISSRDSRTTSGGGYYIPFSFYESTAPNTLHFIIFFLVLIFFIFKKKILGIQKYYLFSTVLGFILFSIVMKWAIQNNRHLLSFFVLIAPIFSYFLFKIKSKKLNIFLIIFLSIYSILYILFNKSRPLLASISFENHNINFSKPFFLNKERNELYYVADSFFTSRNLYASHFEIAKKINEINCRIVGFDSFDFNDMQYPLWVLIKKNSHNINTKIFNLNINNKSSVYVNNEFVEKKICAIIYFDKEIRLLLF